jgi:transcriptional regulator GlxA family with amidase domain
MLGCSVHDKTREVRVQLAIAMLTETQMPISQIAWKLDFPDAPHFSRYFRHARGLSPAQYREQFAP